MCMHKKKSRTVIQQYMLRYDELLDSRPIKCGTCHLNTV